jgi:hypothetical protein
MVTGYSIRNALENFETLSVEDQNKYLNLIEGLNAMGLIVTKDIHLISKYRKQNNDKTKSKMHGN